MSHSAGLSIETDALQVEMGKYLTVKITHTGEESPGSADLQQWQDDFHIDRRGSNVDVLFDGQIQTIEQLRLYPKRTGELPLEAIALGGAIATSESIESLPAVRNEIDGTPSWQELPKTIWQGQSFDVAINMNRLHPSNHIAAEELVSAGWTIQELPRTEHTDKHGTSVTLHWRLLTHGSGQLAIKPPAIEQRGRGRWRFYLPSPVVTVLPLPSYIPPTVPVGIIELTPSLTEQSGAQHWQLQVRSESKLPDGIHGLRQQLAAIAGVETDQITMQSNDNSEDGEVQIYRIPLPDWSWGLGKGPRISVDYFNTDTGQLAIIENQLPAVWRVPFYAKAILAALGLVMATASAKTAKQMVFSMIKKRRLSRRLRHVKTPDELRTLLLSTTKTHNLSEWRESLPTHPPETIVKQLNQACFHPVSAGHSALKELKDSIRKVS